MSGLDIPNLIDMFSNSLIKDNVGISEFVSSDKYLGKKLWPRQQTLIKTVFLEEMSAYDRKVIKEWGNELGEVKLCPKLESRIEYLKANGYPHFRTVQLVGGRRSGKGYMTACMIAYKVYLLTQLESVGKEFGIDEGKSIYFSIVADSLEQAKAHQFTDAQNMVMDVKPLYEQRLLARAIAESVSIMTPYDVRKAAALRARGMKVDKDMASLIIKAFGTNARTIRGSASIMFIFDEMAHLIGGESRMSDEELYKASVPSLMQFKKDAMIIANSSPWTKQGKFFELYEQSLQLSEDSNGEPNGPPAYPDHFMIQFPSWEMYTDGEQFGMPPALAIDPKYDPILAREEQADPESFKVEYRAQFAEVIDSFLNADMVDRMYSPIYTQRMLGRNIAPTEGAIGFMRYKGHGDPASVGANFGIAIGHVEEIMNPDTAIKEEHVVFDFIDAFYPEDFKNPKEPDQPGTINWLEVIPTIVELINRFRPFEFTFDQFDSTMAIQQLKHDLSNLGIGESMVYSKVATAALNDRRWKNFRAALNLGRVHAPHPDTFPNSTKNSIELSRNELKFLQEKNGRVDKQSIGPIRTKDIADCIAEVTDALIGDTISSLHSNLGAGIEYGAQGGYGIGHIGNTDQFPELAELYSGLRKENPRHTPRMPHRGRQTRREW